MGSVRRQARQETRFSVISLAAECVCKRCAKGMDAAALPDVPCSTKTRNAATFTLMHLLTKFRNQQVVGFKSDRRLQFRIT
jgi:hypothetical protein